MTKRWYVTASSPEGTVHDEAGRVIVPHDPQGASEETMENAALIAAAPELLESLEEILKRVSGTRGYFSEEIINKARAAIAKAKG